MTTNTGRVVDALKGIKSALTLAEIAERANLTKKKASSALTSLVKFGSVNKHKEGAHLCGYTLNPEAAGDAVPSRRRRGKAKRTTLHDIVRNYTGAAGPGLKQRHVATTLAVLEATIDLERADAQVRAAFNSHKEAIELAAGAS